ncbi:MAG TPA: dephospho-CoA kinase [Steroidobacteraceae bacterium]|nr:dephospho-CoA kinase [Steroidobacteraceae bacterium]
MPPLRIGLTGGIASGKSAVARRFAELGVPVIDADEIARAIVEPGEAAHGEVVRRFGGAILAANGELDRHALRKLIFSDAEARRDLEAILHPRIQAQMRRRAAALRGPYLVMVIPLLVEGGSREGLDRILVVDADEDVRLRRLIDRDGGTVLQARAILDAQASRAARLQLADDVLMNDGSLQELRGAVDDLHRRYLELAAAAGAATADRR